MVLNKLKKIFQILTQYSVLFFLTIVMSFLSLVADAQAETRSLKIYYVHTKERGEIVFKRNGKYDPEGLKRLNYFLRDWRRNEPTNMDPRLFDLIWTVYQLSGARDYIHVVSAYRSLATNNMLRSRSKNTGVAKHSQHTLGHALDFFLPDVNLSKLRAIGLRQQVGGVGYYPKSGSPFVHMDTGSVRHWPRMSRGELLALFPNGRTLHVPSDGKPLQGYQQALAEYKMRSGMPIQIAAAEPKKKSGGLFSGLFGRKDKEPASTPEPVPVPSLVPSVPPSAPQAQQEQVEMVALPRNNAPIPSFSPRHVAVEEEDDDDEAAIVMAYANVPLPNYKPSSFDSVMRVPASNETVEALIKQSGDNGRDMRDAASAIEQNSAAETIAETTMPPSFPIPQSKEKDAETTVASQIAQASMSQASVSQASVSNELDNSSIITASVAIPQNKPRDFFRPAPVEVSAASAAIADVGLHDAQIMEVSDQISKLISEGYDEADGAKAEGKPVLKSASNDALAKLIASDESVIPVPRDDEVKSEHSDDYYYGKQVAAAGLPTKVATTNRPSRVATSSFVHVRQALPSDDELHAIPSMVFVSQLEKADNKQSQYSALSGKAVDFYPVARVYKTY